jgi:hypothetical protein
MSKLINKIALGLTALLILGSLGACSNKSKKALEPEEGEVGRYLPFNVSETRFDVLDTKTGRMYRYWEGNVTYVDLKDAEEE